MAVFNPISELTPLSEVKLYNFKSVDRTYKNVVYFRSISDQAALFEQQQNKVTFSNLEPIRISTNAVRLNIPADTAYKCNYMSFINPNFNPTFRFYAFITSVDWVNVNCCVVNFEIDVFNTYWLYCDTVSTLVLRSHVYQTVNEKPGDNIEPETVMPTDYTEKQLLGSGRDIGLIEKSGAGKLQILILYAPKTAADTDGEIQGNYFIGCKSMAYDVTNYQAAIAFLKTLDVEQIISIYVVPQLIVPKLTNTVSVAVPIPSSLPYSYQPRNKKLYTYPYNFCRVYAGSSQYDLRFEMFGNGDLTGNMTFGLTGSVGSPPSVICEPAFRTGRRNRMMTINNYPQCLSTANVARQYASQGGVALSILDAVGKITNSVSFGGLLGGSSGAGGQAASAVLNATLDLEKTFVKNYFAPQDVRGSLSDTAALNSGLWDFLPYQTTALEDDIKRLDEYFNVYGYADNQIRQVLPDQVGAHYSYWKTASPVVKPGSISACAPPSEAIATINQAFYNGVTFWKSSSSFLDYNVDNRY